MNMRIMGLAAAMAFGLGAVVTPAHADPALEAVLEARSDEDKVRDQFRHPKETLEFFGVTSSSRVVEALPGGGWYTRILLPLVAENGAYAGANYQADMFKILFGDRLTEERYNGLKNWPETFPGRAAEWVEGEPEVKAWSFGSAPQDLYGTMDHVLFIRALHNLKRSGGTYLEEAVLEAYELLKPGGVVGVVQHRAPADASDDWANGSAGYIKESALIATFEEAGFQLAEKSEINANPKDKPTADDIVWRLPPSLRVKDEELKKKNQEIGESDRMTLKFVKPEAM